MINNLLPLFVSLEFNESDRRALIVLIIVLIIVLLIIGLIGMGIRWICHKQSEAADNIMYDVTVTHVVMNPQAYRKLANKKSFRLFFRASQIPLLIILVGVLVWIIVAAIRNSWNENIFEDFLDLFFLWHYEGEEDGIPEHYRVPAEGDKPRDAQDITFQEAARCAIYVCKTQFGMPREDLIRQTSHALGFKNSGGWVGNLSEAAVNFAVSRGLMTLR